MKHVLCAVLDTKASYHGRPFTARTTGEAIRIFSDGVRDKETPMNSHPEDYVLYQIGYFDDETGNIEPEHKLLISGTSI